MIILLDQLFIDAVQLIASDKTTYIMIDIVVDVSTVTYTVHALPLSVSSTLHC